MPIPIPQQVNIQYMLKVFPGIIAPGVHSTIVWMDEHSSTQDLIEAVLEKLNIPAGIDRFDLVEVYNENGEFSDAPELGSKARMLRDFDCPAQIQKVWMAMQSENEAQAQKHRMYLRQKSENRISEKLPDVRVTWLDGLNYKNASMEDFQFDEPLYKDEFEIDDLVELPVLNEDILMDHLEKRFNKGHIYTYVGGILISINPFKYFPIYNPKYVAAYQHKRLGELRPHVFAIADAAYQRMLKDKKDQCIVISGESGSGKTESTKLILHHLTALSHKTQATALERTILGAGPVLEAFGNATTCHNNNSSRFGKFTQINYRADGVVCGAVLKKYLLEKSRIVAQSDQERNYHVFYYLFAGARQNEKDVLHLTRPEDYAYLNQNGGEVPESVDESYEFLKLKQAMNNIGFTYEVQQRLFAILAAVLHIGNINFERKVGHEDAVEISNDECTGFISDLLQVEKPTISDSFTRRKTVTRGEEFIRLYSYDEAIATRNAMAKALYGSLVDWIVLQINHTLVTTNHRNTEKKAFSIGVLDIFGFEDFDINSFEQFCINFANENLQYYLNEHIFKMRQNEYVSEHLDWTVVDYNDNYACLKLVSGKPVGLINLLDEECSLTVGTDQSLLEKFNKHHANNPLYEMPPTREPAFSVVHYAGAVKYQIKDFKVKNQDLMRPDVVIAMRNSKMLFVRDLMGADPMAVYHWSIIRNMIRAISLFRMAGKARREGRTIGDVTTKVTWAFPRSPPMKPKLFKLTDNEMPETRALIKKATKVLTRRDYDLLLGQSQSTLKFRQGLAVKRYIAGGMSEHSQHGHRRNKGGLKNPPTVIAQFQSSLSELMDTLNASHPYFVRCIRSNTDKAPLRFDADVVLRQLRYTGMLKTVKIRQAGYPCRISIEDFLAQYKLLLPRNHAAQDLSAVLHNIGLDPSHFQVGTSKVFMREKQYRFLRDRMQEKVDKSARIIQKFLRTVVARRRLLHRRRSAIIIQATWRGYVARKAYEYTRFKDYAALRIQETWHMYKLRKQFLKSQKAALALQTHWRGLQSRRLVAGMKERKSVEEMKRIEDEKQKVVSDKAQAFVVDTLAGTIFIEEESDKSDKDKDRDYSHHIYEDITKFQKERADSDVSNESGVSSGRNTPYDVVGSESEADLEKEKKFKSKLKRRLSFVKEKSKTTTRKRNDMSQSNDEHLGTANHGYAAMTLDRTSMKLNFDNHKKKEKSGFFTLWRGQSRRDVMRFADKESEMKLPAGSPMSRGGREWTPTKNYVVQGDSDLEALNSFLAKKVSTMNKPNKGKRDTIVDSVFRVTLQEYHASLLTTYAGVFQRNETIMLKYDDMAVMFQKILDRIIEKEGISANFPVIMGMNAFGGVVDEFVKSKKQGVKRMQRKMTKRKRKNTSDTTEFNGHIYAVASFGIATFCECCNSLIWDKGYVCEGCKFTCHRKCMEKHPRPCRGRLPSLNGPQRLFCSNLEDLATATDPIPVAVMKLMQELEMRGLYSEGIYRKPGLQSSIKSLKNAMMSTDARDLVLDDYRVFVMSSVLKLFCRQLPRPVVPEEFYNDFIRTADLENEADIYTTLYELMQRFPKSHGELLERLIFHLARVALNEDSNKMSANSLAIVWAPCLIRAPDNLDPLETLQQLPQQTLCVEVLIKFQAKKIRKNLSDISVLEKATLTAEFRLSNIIRQRMQDCEDARVDYSDDQTDEENVLQQQISTMAEEQSRLTEGIASLEPENGRCFVTDSDDGLTSDDGFTDLEAYINVLGSPESADPGSKADSFERDPKSKALSPGHRQRVKLRGFGDARSCDSSFEDLAADNL